VVWMAAFVEPRESFAEPGESFALRHLCAGVDGGLTLSSNTDRYLASP